MREKYLKMVMVKILFKAEKQDIRQGLYSKKNIFEKDQFHLDGQLLSLEQLNRAIQEMEFQHFHIDEIMFYRDKALQQLNNQNLLVALIKE